MRSLLRIALAGAALIARNSDQPPGRNSTADQVTANALGPELPGPQYDFASRLA